MRKGQATVFIIAGLLIVAISLLLYAFRTELLGQFGDDATTNQPTNEQMKRVKVFTEDCISSALENAVQQMGIQGGYLTLPEDAFPPAPYNVLSNAVDIFGEGGLKVPYWSYVTPNNIERTAIPTKQEMTESLRVFVEREVDACTNDYLLFSAEGYTITATPPRVEITIADEAVIAEVLLNLDVTYKEINQRFSKMKVEVDAPLGSLYTRALEIMQYESQTTFLENFTLETMAMYDEIPYSGIDMDCTPRAWLRTKMIMDLKKILALNIPTLKVAKTDYVLRTKLDEILVHDAIKGSEKDMSVRFMFSENWPMLIDVIGEDGAVLRGQPLTSENEASKFLLPLFCLNDYHFVYDIQYPIVVQLSKDDYMFQYGIMSVIDNNQPKKNTVIVPQFSEGPTVCDRADTEVRVVASGIASDGTPVPMKDVDVSLQCVFEECSLGTTRDEVGGAALVTFVPSCLGGQLVGSKPGYHQGRSTVDTMDGGIISVALEPYHSLPVDVYIQDGTQTRVPYDTETVFFQFQNEDKDYFTSYMYPSDAPLQLIAGSYTVDATLLVETDQGFHFDKQTIEICVDAPKKGIGGFAGMTEKECSQQVIEPMDLDTVLVGGGSYGWSVAQSILATSNKIVLYAKRGPTPTTLTALNSVYENKEAFSKGIKKPTFE